MRACWRCNLTRIGCLTLKAFALAHRLVDRMARNNRERPGDDTRPIPDSDEGGKFIVTILMVEDTEEIRLPVAKMLRKKGFEVLDTGDGSVAVDLYRAQAALIDIVLLDLNLPGMSGEEILKELQKIRPDVKVIVTTSHARDRTLAAVGGSQSCSYIRKPYQFTDLIDALRKNLPEKRM